MGIFDNLINGVKGVGSSIGNGIQGLISKNNPTYGNIGNTANNIIAGVNQGGTVGSAIDNTVNGTPQNGGAIVNAINNSQIQPQTNNSANKIVNAIKNSQLRPSNWTEGTRQTVSNILLGIGKNALSNPNGDVWSNLLGGANAGLQNQIAYKNAVNTMQNSGFDTTGMSPYADYSQFTPDKILSIGVKQQQNQMRKDIANANDNTKRLTLIMNNYNKGSISAEEAQSLMKMYGLDVNNLQESNDTRKTNSQIEVNDTRKKYLEASIKQNEQKIAIYKQKVAQGKATSSDKAELNRLNIENKKLIIEQNKLINKGLEDQLSGGGDRGGNTGGRPVGQRGNIIKSF